MDLKQLQEPIPYKYRLQSAKNGRATIVSYIDSRQVQDRLDEVVGAGRWQTDFKFIDGKLFGGIGIMIDNINGQPLQWVWKWDVGTESNVDKEKGEVSDAIKRAAVQWGIGRFLYSLGIITLKAKTHTNGKEYPCKDDGTTILWNVDDLTEYCKLVVESGELDRTKNGVKPIGKAVIPSAKTITTPQIPKESINTLTDNKAEVVKPTDTKEGTKLDEADVASTIKAFAKFDNAAVLSYLIKEKKFKYTSVNDFIKGEDTKVIKEVYNHFNKK
jgi:hypothetical protein